MEKWGLFFLFLVLVVSSVSAQEFSREHAYNEINLQKPFIMNIDDGDFPVTRVEIFVNESFFNIKVKAESIEKIPHDDTTYYQFRLSSILDNEDIKASRITFRVKDSFIVRNSILLPNIYLAKYDNGWKKLDTNYLREEDNFHYYSAIGDGIYVFAVAAEQEDNIRIKTESLPSNIVRSRTFVLPIRIQNMATVVRDYIISTENTRNLADWKIETGEKNTPKTIMIEPKETKQVSLIMTIKNDALFGENTFDVIITTAKESLKFPVTIDIKAIEDVFGEHIIKIEKQFDEIAGNNNKIKISIINNGPETIRYIIKTDDIEYFGDYILEPSHIVLVDSRETEDVLLNIIPKQDIEEDTYDFSVSVGSNLEVIMKKDYSVNVVPYYKEETTNLTPIVISFALLIVAFIFFILAKKRRK